MLATGKISTHTQTEHKRKRKLRTLLLLANLQENHLGVQSTDDCNLSEATNRKLSIPLLTFPLSRRQSFTALVARRDVSNYTVTAALCSLRLFI